MSTDRFQFVELEQCKNKFKISITYYNYEKAKAETFLCFFHVQIYQRKELCQWIFHGSCYLNCWVRLQIQSVMFSAAQRKIEKNENRR